MKGGVRSAHAIHTLTHGVVGGVFSVLDGGTFGHGFASAGTAAFFSPVVGEMGNGPARVIAAAVIGGTASVVSGGKFANGAITAAFVQAFNHNLPHETGRKRPRIVPDPNFVGSMTRGDEIMMRDLNSGLEVVESVFRASGDLESIELLDTALLVYTPDLPYSALAHVDETPKRIQFGRTAMGFTFPGKIGPREYFGRINTRGGDVAVASLIIHEFGHLHSGYNRYSLPRGTRYRTHIENQANRYTQMMFQYLPSTAGPLRERASVLFAIPERP